ncbi:hypothetical protein EUTSA_v10024234mg [Eutrema salsugineum]|uniref:ADP-ribosyl cyclase/cyclic ADP-ribose hydrolase n=1 Tax=Eutrema salsugineum TaxID=72664 RepID=V4MFB1_EUTSA|nr:hypothetical protein EUTSA_v10024234mg [Eutrema salsugineum]
MDSSILITILAAAIGFFMIFRKIRSHQENKEIDSSSSSLSTSSVPPSLSSPSSVPSSSSSHNWIHDVFPSFRGEDVREEFLSHIKKEFGRKGITPFNDNGIKRGESIGPELIRAIRESKIAIVLLSKNYASSKWCLDELVEIMKCREELGQTVMAVFYKVDPSDVKKLLGDFGKVFRKTCAGKRKEDIGRWRQALEKVATIAGYHSNNWDDEAAMIEKIAIDVSNELINNAPSSDFDGFIGMGAHMEKMEPFLLLGSNEVRMIGILGPSGIGKSTIARVLYSKYSHHFQLIVFMENIKRRYPRLAYDEYSTKLQLQNEFLSQIINQEGIKIHHLGVAQDRLKDKRVLVVLDDVDHLVQLDAMAKETRWFGPGSRIIITTQDKRLLNAHGINHIYEVGFPHEDEALEIFCMAAFGQNSPYEGFKILAREVTGLGGRLPLGLRVMGSYLKGRSEQEWRQELPRLRTSLDGEIESVLEFSYNALRAEDKALFLYIACFFNNERIEKVQVHLAKNFSNVSQGLQVLAEKSLISISGWGSIEMHDLLARLGKEIVGRQAIHDPGERQFLVNAQDICQVLNNDTLGSKRVIGIDLKYHEIKDELKISERAFERMSSLQFLRTRGDSNYALQPRPNYLPPKVTLLHCEYFPMTCLPSRFNPNFLVELNMPRSRLEKLWKGIKTIKNLKWMDLSYSENLKELPDLSTASSLQELKLKYCSSLVKLPSSIGNAVNLQKLDLSKCSSLVKLPSSIGNAVNLQKLNLSRCSSLVEVSSSIGYVINLKKLNLCGCSSIVNLPFSIGNVTSLQRLDLSGCLSLVELPSSIRNLINLQKLDLSDCSSLVELPSSIWNVFNSNLKELNLRDCSSVVKLPSFIVNVVNLEKLNISGCSSLVKLSSSMGNAVNLNELNLSGCSSIVKLPFSIGNVTNLQELNLKGCSSLVELPFSIGNLINLTELDLSGCSSLAELPSSIGNAVNLQKLDLNGCSSLVELPSSIENLRNLLYLPLKGCSKLEALPININMESLHKLDLTDCSSLKSHCIILSTCKCNTGMYRLHTLVLERCTNLVSLPELPGSLRVLLAENCESLETLDCSFHKTEFDRLRFINCFKLNQDAIDLIIKTSIGHYGHAVLPGEKVPTYFTYRNNGSSISVNLNETDTHFPISLRFKACVLLVNKGGNWSLRYLYCRINGVNSRIPILTELSPCGKEHLFIFEYEAQVSSSELVFEFEFSEKKLEIGECGIQTSVEAEDEVSRED